MAVLLPMTADNVDNTLIFSVALAPYNYKITRLGNLGKICCPRTKRIQLLALRDRQQRSAAARPRTKWLLHFLRVHSFR